MSVQYEKSVFWTGVFEPEDSLLRIAILYNRDIYALKALNLLLPALTGHTLLLGHSSRVGQSTGTEPEALRRLAEAEKALLDAAITSDTPAGYRHFSGMARDYTCEDLSFNDINQTTGLSRLADFAPDLVLSIRFGKILKAEVLAIPSIGVLNLHSGLLPAYRGVMATFRAMLAGDATLGATLHWIPDPTIDTGPTVDTVVQPLDPLSSYMAHVWRLYEAGVPMMINAVHGTARGELSPNSATAARAHDEGQYFSFPDEATLAEFAGRGLRLFTPADIDTIATDLGLATVPSPGAVTD